MTLPPYGRLNNVDACLQSCPHRGTKSFGQIFAASEKPITSMHREIECVAPDFPGSVV